MTSAGLGITMAVLATIAYQLGLVAEKRALGKLPNIDPRRAVSMISTLLSAPAWLAGFALMLGGLALQIAALTLAPVTIVQPVQAAGVVLLLAASRIALREKLRAGELVGIIIIGVSVAAISLSATGSAGSVGHHANPVALAGVTGCALLVGALLGAGLLRSAESGRALPAGPVPYGISAGLFYGVAALAIKGLSATILRGHLGFALAGAVVISPYLYLLAGSSAVGLVLFQAGLQRCQLSVIGPVSNLTGSVFFMVAGTWLFAERLPADPGRLTLRIAGIVAAVTVVAVLSRRPAVIELGAATDGLPAPMARGTAGQAATQRRAKGVHRRPRPALLPRPQGQLRTPPGQLRGSPGQLQGSPAQLKGSPGQLQGSPGQPQAPADQASKSPGPLAARQLSLTSHDLPALHRMEWHE